MNEYIEILNMFVSTDDKLRVALTFPNIGERVASATDGFSLVFFDKNLLPNGTSFNGDIYLTYPDISFLINKRENQRTKLDLAKINLVLEKCPLIKDTDEEEQEDECSECSGSGEVEFEYEANDYRTYYKSGDCPICDGDGTTIKTIKKPNGKMVRNNEYFLQINNCYVSILLMERLLQVQKLLNEDIYIVTQTESNKEIIFKIGEVKVVFMPSMINRASDYCLGNIA